LNDAVECKSFKSVGSRFQAQGAATEKEYCHQSSDSFLVRPSHSSSTNAATTVKECRRRASTGWQCNQKRARRTSYAQAGTACTVFSV